MTQRPAELIAAVDQLLTSAPAFAQLLPGERDRIGRNLSRVLAFVTDPAAGDPKLAETARALDDSTDAVDRLKQRIADKPRLVGADFKAGASTAGAKIFKDLVSTVDFPKFVAGLIDGVFTSIVNSSIRQMREYGKMLEAVVKSLEEFARDYIGAGQARQYLVDSFPDSLTLDAKADDSGMPKLAVKDGADPPDLKSFLGTPDSFNLDDSDGEQKLIAAAQLKMARMRQTELATMVLLGINRIVVTEGEINAKVVFDIKASDTASRHSGATLDDTKSQSFGYWDDGFFGDSLQITTVHADSAEDSDARLSAKANLSGSISVKFKSETFPLDRIASAGDLITMKQKSQKPEAAKK